MGIDAVTHPHRSLAAIFAGPIMLAMLSAAGLVSALFGDHLWDAASWLALGAPLVATVYFVVKRAP
jgi:hypothetical protein